MTARQMRRLAGLLRLAAVVISAVTLLFVPQQAWLLVSILVLKLLIGAVVLTVLAGRQERQ